MRSLILARHARANVWLDEIPLSIPIAGFWMSRRVNPTAVVCAHRKVAAVELSIPHGPTSSYALLGAEVLEHSEPGLEIAVLIHSSRSRLENSIVVRPDEVYTGLLDEYAEAVFSGVEAAMSTGAPDHKVIRFCWAAHAVAGSSPAVFERASRSVAKLILLPPNPTEGEIRTLLE